MLEWSVTMYLNCSEECESINSCSPAEGDKFSKDDGIYVEIFAVKNGVRYNLRRVGLTEVSTTLTNAVMDGIGKLCQVEL